MEQGRLKEAKAMLKSMKSACGDSPWGSISHLKSFDRAQQMLQDMEAEERWLCLLLCALVEVSTKPWSIHGCILLIWNGE